MNTPFRLDEGVYFEDTGHLLKWGEDLNIIAQIDSPDISSNGNVFKWCNKLYLNGHTVNVSIIKDSYYNTNGYLEFVDFELERNDPWGVYKKFSAIFKSQFGQPTESINDVYGRPTDLWNIKDLQIIIGVGERFVEYEIFSIHKGKIFCKFKDQTTTA
jgi:hypothetical protein